MLEQTIGNVTQGNGAGLDLYGVLNVKMLMHSAGSHPFYDEGKYFDHFAIGSYVKKGLLKQEFVEKVSFTVDDVKELKKLSEMGNDVFYQITLNNGDVSVVKTYLRLRISEKTIVNPAGTLTQLLITKLVQ